MHRAGVDSPFRGGGFGLWFLVGVVVMVVRMIVMEVIMVLLLLTFPLTVLMAGMVVVFRMMFMRHWGLPERENCYNMTFAQPALS